MKIKGITLIEQHVEKIVLGLVGAVAVALAAMQFLGQGNTIEINNQPLSASQVDGALENKARSLEASLRDDAPATVQPPDSPRVLNWIRTAVKDSVSPPLAARLSVPSYTVAIGGGREERRDMEFVVPVFAAAGKPFVDQHADAIDDEVLSQLPEDVRQHVVSTTGGPHDMSWTTPAVLMDVKALREQYAAKDPDDSKLPIPARWYDSRVYFLDLEIEREELIGGQWSDRQLIPAMPDLREHRERINGRDPAGPMTSAATLLDWLREPSGANQAQIIQPWALPTVGSSWVQPEVPVAEGAASNPAMAEITQLQRQIATQRTLREAVAAQLDRLGGPLDESGRSGSGGGSGRGTGGGRGGGPPPPGGGGSGGGPPPGGGGGGGGGVDLGDERSGGERSTDAARIRLTNRLRGIDATITRLEDLLRKRAAELGIQLNPDRAARRYPNLLLDDQVLVWGHDLKVTPGATYRYRITARVYNPFFGKTAFLVPSQQQLAKDVCMNVQTSEWSDPVTVKPLTRFFVTAARPDDAAGALGIGEATIEVYRLFRGQWYLKSFRVQPGEPIGQVESSKTSDGQAMSVDFRTSAFVQDVLRVPDEGRTTSTSRGGKVVVSLPDGTLVVRDPASDSSDPERQALSRGSSGL